MNPQPLNHSRPPQTELLKKSPAEFERNARAHTLKHAKQVTESEEIAPAPAVAATPPQAAVPASQKEATSLPAAEEPPRAADADISGFDLDDEVYSEEESSPDVKRPRFLRYPHC